MRTRSAIASPSDRGDSLQHMATSPLDENIWGTLQHHIDLAESMYSKLPFEEFFNLRTVCKDWYVIACKRLGLKEPIHKPFFIFRASWNSRPDGILFYNALSRSWNWRPDWNHRPSSQAVVNKGMVFSPHSTSFGDCASWSLLPSPNQEQQRHCDCPDTVGVWNGRVLDVTCDFDMIYDLGPGRPKENWSLQVWELVSEEMHEWKVYDCMPKGLCSWLQSTTGFRDDLYTEQRNIVILSSFCGDFILVYSWDSENGSSGRFCLFNMATKNWQKLNIDAGIITYDKWGD